MPVSYTHLDVYKRQPLEVLFSVVRKLCLSIWKLHTRRMELLTERQMDKMCIRDRDPTDPEKKLVKIDAQFTWNGYPAGTRSAWSTETVSYTHLDVYKRQGYVGY